MKFHRRTLPALATIALGITSLASHAAPQCLTRGPGTYGAVTVSGCEPVAGAITNPFDHTNSRLTYDGILFIGIIPVSPVACTLTFSHPIATSSVALSLDAHQRSDVLTLSLNGSVYTPLAADISPLPGAASPNPLVISGNTLIGIGSLQDTPRSLGSAGIVRFTNQAPAALTSLTFEEMPGDGGTLIGVCFDDALAPPAAVPTQSAGAMAGMALMAGLLGAWQIRRRRRRGSAKPTA
ncbi:hypothetical protein FVQ98_12570 [Ottowia sp. GY511]|uniref:IPTL-CTERM sorting domain-containing protein n=1 Tax=Ottowia flava TaxID=2675430 RepID=A0ABW4KYF9_9BURK|nr:hypothetical protein [Ottowia sp. GY511]TXK27096.1 hypothetical protein FVQ98_12570 [Ottowia sp. GY511]